MTYAHTGWRQVDGRWVYLFPGHSVGVSGVDVRNPDDSERYVLPSAEATTDAIAKAVRRSLDLMVIGEAMVSVPAVAAAYTAVLSSILEVDFAVWYAGSSGACKSGLAGLVMLHFGRWSYSSLPMAWTSTANSIEALLFRAKDCLMVIDNFIPGLDRDGVTKASRIIQQIGDRGSRGRLAKDSQAMPSRPPRGLVCALGRTFRWEAPTPRRGA